MRALVDLIERHRPGFAETVQPAPEEIVEALVELAGPLPGAYRRFLATMGGGTGEFKPLDVNFDVEDRLVNYQVRHSLRKLPYLLIGAGGPLEPGGSLYLDRGHPTCVDDCLLVIIPPGDPPDTREAAPFHVGLEEFLYVEAYRELRLPLLTAWAELLPADSVEPPISMVEEVFAIAARLGFSRVPPAERSALYERGDAALVLYRHPLREDFSFQLASNDRAELKRLVDIYRSQLPLRLLQ